MRIRTSRSLWRALTSITLTSVIGLGLPERASPLAADAGDALPPLASLASRHAHLSSDPWAPNLFGEVVSGRPVKSGSLAAIASPNPSAALRPVPRAFPLHGLGFGYRATVTVFGRSQREGITFYSRMHCVSIGEVRGGACRPGLNKTVGVTPYGLATRSATATDVIRVYRNFGAIQRLSIRPGVVTIRR
jgi:hypothetical protein